MARDTLTEPQRIAIIGGGPSGALSALQLCRQASEAGRELEVTVFDRKEFGVSGPRDCNMCAGVVSSWMIEQLESVGVEVPNAVVQRRIDAYTLEVRGAQVRLPKPPGARIHTAFRSGGPLGAELGANRSFDGLLLRAAVAAGARHVPLVVRRVRLPDSPHDPVVLLDAAGEEHAADAVIGAFGVNSHMLYTFEALGFGYRMPRTAMGAQCEIQMSTEEIEATFGNEVRAFSLGVPGVSVSALIPKERHVTVCLIGRAVGQIHLEHFLQLPEVRAHFPPGWELPEDYCHCHPRLPITAARNVVTDRVLVVGDAFISRYLKNGLDSAFVTSSLAARAILAGGVSREHLLESYVEPCRQAFAGDNACGRLLFGVQRLLERLPRLAAVHLRSAEREQENGGAAPLSSILWGMLTGEQPNTALLRQALSPRLQARLAWETFASLF